MEERSNYSHHRTIPLSQSKETSSLHNAKTSVDNMKNETVNHHCTMKDISPAHVQENA